MKRVKKQQSAELKTHELVVIACPKCRGALRLEDFEITHHADSSWSADPGIECTYDDCNTKFFITHSMIEYGIGSKL